MLASQTGLFAWSYPVHYRVPLFCCAAQFAWLQSMTVTSVVGGGMCGATATARADVEGDARPSPLVKEEEKESDVRPPGCSPGGSQSQLRQQSLVQGWSRTVTKTERTGLRE